MEYEQYINSPLPKSLIIMFHGYGANRFDLISLAPALSRSLPDVAFVSPDGFNPCMGLGATDASREWFSLPSNLDDLSDKHKNYLDEQLELIASKTKEFIDSQAERFNLSLNRVVLLGFSQGAMVALYASLRAKDSFAGVVSFSGMIGHSNELSLQLSSRPPVALIHGSLDEVIDKKHFFTAKETLLSNGCEVSSLLRADLGHSIDEFSINFASDFLKAILSSSAFSQK